MMSKKRLNCPNCGAPITGIRCEYCGTQFLDFATIDMDEPFYIRIKQGNGLMTCKAMVKEFNVHCEPPEFDILYARDLPFYRPNISGNRMDMELRMESVVHDSNNILYEIMEVEEDD